jgi:hypothetical protein
MFLGTERTPVAGVKAWAGTTPPFRNASVTLREAVKPPEPKADCGALESSLTAESPVKAANALLSLAAVIPRAPRSATTAAARDIVPNEEV